MELNIIHNKESGIFETVVDNQTAYIKYHQPSANQIAIVSTLVPTEIGGRGIAGIMTKHVLDYAKENKLTVIPICSYTATYIERHAEYKDLIK